MVANNGKFPEEFENFLKDFSHFKFIIQVRYSYPQFLNDFNNIDIVMYGSKSKTILLLFEARQFFLMFFKNFEIFLS